jgi:hypothetical protein
MDPSFKGNFSKGHKIGRPEKVYTLKSKLEDNSFFIKNFFIKKSLALKDSYTFLHNVNEFL